MKLELGPLICEWGEAREVLYSTRLHRRNLMLALRCICEYPDTRSISFQLVSFFKSTLAIMSFRESCLAPTNASHPFPSERRYFYAK